MSLLKFPACKDCIYFDEGLIICETCEEECNFEGVEEVDEDEEPIFDEEPIEERLTA